VIMTHCISPTFCFLSFISNFAFQKFIVNHVFQIIFLKIDE